MDVPTEGVNDTRTLAHLNARERSDMWDVTTCGMCLLTALNQPHIHSDMRLAVAKSVLRP